MSSASVPTTNRSWQWACDLNLRTFLGLDPNGHAGFSAIRATVTLDADVADDVLDELHQTVVATSPVGDTLTRPVAVQIDLG